MPLIVRSVRTAPVDRPAVTHAVDLHLPLSVYGQDWQDEVPPRYFIDETFPNHLLPDLYRSAEVVLNDHWPSMIRAGIISNRVFDVLATGTPLVTDAVAGLEDVFGDELFVYANDDDFATTVRRARSLSDDDSARLKRLADTVRRDHSFTARVDTITTDLRNIASPRLGRPVWPERLT